MGPWVGSLPMCELVPVEALLLADVLLLAPGPDAAMVRVRRRWAETMRSWRTCATLGWEERRRREVESSWDGGDWTAAMPRCSLRWMRRAPMAAVRSSALPGMVALR